MSRPDTSIHGQWSSLWAFILAATGSAVGLGNIWKFPYIAGENGGGAFVLVYLICIASIGIPLMVAEIMLGRRGRQNLVSSLQSLAQEENTRSVWRYLGWSGIIAGFLILSYYSVIAGQVMAYVIRTFSGVFEGVTADGAKSIHMALTNDPERLLFWHTLFILITMAVVAGGVKSGLERYTKFLMPALFAILLLLVGFAINTGDYFNQAINFLFRADFTKLTGSSVLVAMGHAFFTLSLGMGAIMMYGSYLPKNVSIMKVSVAIASADTLVALLAGIAIFPLVFANGLGVDAGPSLIFKTLPMAFGHMAGGALFGGLFFLLLFLAAWSSAISLIEPFVVWLIEKRNMTRLCACFYAGFSVWLLGLLTVFSFNIASDWLLFEKTMFDLLDYLTANIMLPLGGLFIAIFSGWLMKQASTKEELGVNDTCWSYKLWLLLIRYVIPIAIMVIFITSLGIF